MGWILPRELGQRETALLHFVHHEPAECLCFQGMIALPGPAWAHLPEPCTLPEPGTSGRARDGN